MQSKPLRAWKSLGATLLVSAPPWLDVYREAVELPSGRRLGDFYRVVMPDFVVIVPRTADGRFVTARGYKHGLGRVTLSAPAGVIERGEEPLAAARRELREETGYTAPDWVLLGKHVVDGNRQCGTMYTFAARGAVPTEIADENDSEELQVQLLTRAEVVAAMKAGEFGTLAGAGGIALALALDDHL